MARLSWGVRAYGFIAAMWVRSTMAYRASFVMMLLGSFAIDRRSTSSRS